MWHKELSLILEVEGGGSERRKLNPEICLSPQKC